MRLTREKIQRMIKGSTTVAGGSGSGSGGSGGGGGSADYAAEAGHALEADHATSADSATEATHAASADTATTAQNLASDSTDWNKIADKTIAQSIAEVWTFAKGIVSTLKSYFNGGIEVTGGVTTDSVTASGNVSANGTLSGGGLSITNDGRILGNMFIWGDASVDGDADISGDATIDGTLGVTGKVTGNEAEFQTLAVTKSAHFQKLTVDELTSNKGALIITSANCVAELVGEDQSAWFIYFSRTDRDGNAVTNPWKVGDQAICLTFKAEGTGTFDNVKNRYYWRRVIGVYSDQTGPDGNTYHVIHLSKTVGDSSGTTVPAAGDNIVQLGYQGQTSAPERQTAVILSSYPTMDTGVKPPSLAFYKNINGFALSNCRWTYIDGVNNEFIGNFKILVGNNYESLTSVLATIEGLIMTVQAMVRGKNILPSDGWTDYQGFLLGATNYNEQTQMFSNSDGEGSYDDMVWSPVFFLKAGTYTYSHYCSDPYVRLIVYGTSKQFTVDNLPIPDLVDTAIYTQRSGDVYQSKQRRYATFTLANDAYVCLNIYLGDDEFTMYRPMLEEGSVCSDWETGALEHTSQVKILANAINLSIRAGLRLSGVFIEDGQIKLKADRVNFYDSTGTNLNPNIWIDPTAGNLHAVNAFLSGSLLCHRMVRRSGSESYVVCFSGNTADTLALLGDIVIVGGQYSSNLPVRLPPAKFFPGTHIKIINATYSTSGGNRSEDPSIITLEVVHNNNTEPRAEDAFNVATNNLAVAVPFVATSGSNILFYDYYEDLTYDGYIEVDLVSEPNIYENPTSPTHYVWTVIGAREV